MRRILTALILCGMASVAAAQDFIRYAPSFPTTLSAQYGGEQAPAIVAANWTCGAGWDCSVAGTLNKNADGTGTAVPNPALTITAGVTYKLVYTINFTVAGTGIVPQIGGTVGATRTTSGTFTDYITAATTGNLILAPNNTPTRFTITAVSVRALTDATGDLTVDGNLTVRSQIFASHGNAGYPGYSFSADTDSGFYWNAAPFIAVNGTAAYTFGSSTFDIASASGAVRIGGDATLSRSAAATLQLGAADAAAPVNQTLQAQGVVAGTSDVAGGSLTLRPGVGRGSAVPNPITLNRSIVTTTGSTAQTQQSGMVICGTKTLSTTSATAQTIVSVTTTTLTSGGLTLHYGVSATSATAANATTGSVHVSWNNVSGTVAATMGTVINEVQSNSSGTLAATPTVTVATNVVSVKLTPTWATIVPTGVRGFFTVLNQSIDPIVCQ